MSGFASAWDTVAEDAAGETGPQTLDSLEFPVEEVRSRQSSLE